MNALLPHLPAMPPAAAAGRAAPPAAATPLAGATVPGKAAPGAAAPLASSGGFALPLFVDALQAAVAEDAQPLAAKGEFLEPGPAEVPIQPATEPLHSASPIVVGAAPALATSASAASAAVPEEHPAHTVQLAAAMAMRPAPVAVAATPAPQASRPQAATQPLAGSVGPEPASVPRGGADPGLAAARAETAAAGSERTVPSPLVSSTAAVPPGLAVAPGEGAETPALKLPNGPAEQWRQPLAQALGERLHVELGRAGERAVIRLDPPMMGSVEIVIRHEGGNLQVHLTATHAEVLRQLQSIGETLRQDLVNRQFAEVSVRVSDAFREGDGRQREHAGTGGEDGPGRALAEAEAGHDPLAFSLATDGE